MNTSQHGESRTSAQNEDGSIKIREYEDGCVRISLVKRGRFSLNQMWFDAGGGNMLLVPADQVPHGTQ